ncbi:hypothetical protein KXW58_006076 [Aspergillus fumigatus]|nr:hypothetical protein KXW58_006076 [Aspergillus fumigatus]
MAKQRQTQLRDSRTLKEKLSGKAMEDHKAVQQVFQSTRGVATETARSFVSIVDVLELAVGVSRWHTCLPK